MRKNFLICHLFTYSTGGKMKIHGKNAFFYGKNGLEKWKNLFNYEKNSSYISLIYILYGRKNENPWEKRFLLWEKWFRKMEKSI